MRESEAPPTELFGPVDACPSRVGHEPVPLVHAFEPGGVRFASEPEIPVALGAVLAQPGACLGPEYVEVGRRLGIHGRW